MKKKCVFNYIFKIMENIKSITDEFFNSPVKDNRIVRLNEIVTTNLSRLSAKDRPAVREAKMIANFAKANWDSFHLLETIFLDVQKQIKSQLAKEVLKIIENRKNELKISVTAFKSQR